MCGRAYSTYTDEELYLRYSNLRIRRSPLAITPNYNLSPTQQVPVIAHVEGHNQILSMRWGLVPFWAKDIKSASKYSLINAKGEEIEQKRSYQAAFIKRRCIVPLSGFIEWKREGAKAKTPFAIHLKDAPIMSVAGVWEHWVGPISGELVDSFSIITTSANRDVAAIHDRMPVILKPEDEARWLDPSNDDPASLKKLLCPCPERWLSSYEISPLINSPRNNRKELLEPTKR